MLLTTLYEHFKRVTFSIFCTGMVFKSENTTFEIIVMAAILVATFFAVMMWDHNRKPNTYYYVYNKNGLRSTLHCFMQHLKAVLLRKYCF